MIQPAPLPNPQTTAAMDPEPPHLNEDPNPAQSEGSSASPIAVAPTTEPDTARKYLEHLLQKLLENPLQAFLITVVVFLFGFVLTQTNDRISETNDRITRLEDKVDTGFARIDERFTQQDAKFDERFARIDERFARIDERFAQQDAKFDERFAQLDAKFDERFAQQDAKFDEINLKLTALIAALNATAEVEAALDGRLLDPNTTPTDNPAN